MSAHPSNRMNVRASRRESQELRNVPFAASQAEHSLLQCEPETKGVLDASRRMNLALVRYRPRAEVRSARGRTACWPYRRR